jgi:hypothetical protein
MATSGEMKTQFEDALKRTFGNEVRFQQFIFAMVAYGPMVDITDDMVLTKVLSSAQLASTGVKLASASEVLASLKEQGVNWGKAIVDRLCEAEDKWPEMKAEHSVIIGRIKKAF